MSSQVVVVAPADSAATAAWAREVTEDLEAAWWSRRFIDVLESFALGSRLARGRNYAREGAVVAVEVAPGVVTASVRGTRVRPYQVRVGLAPFPELVWAKVEVALAEQAIHSAVLLSGEMPPELENVFTAAGAPLFPRREHELELSCTCPDVAVPCKHVAATFYVLAEAFDADPFQILAWRGRSRDALLQRLRLLRADFPFEAVDAAGAVAALGGPVAPVGGAMLALADLADPVVAPVLAGTAAGSVGAGSGGADSGVARIDATGADAAGSGAAGTGVAGSVAGQGELSRFWFPPVPLPARPRTIDAPPALLLRQLPPPGPALGGARLTEILTAAYERFPIGA